MLVKNISLPKPVSEANLADQLWHRNLFLSVLLELLALIPRDPVNWQFDWLIVDSWCVFGSTSPCRRIESIEE